MQRVHIPILLMLVLASILGSGCQRPAGHSAENRPLQTRIRKNMTREEVERQEGPPSDFRSGGGLRDDVAVYHKNGQTSTLYYYQNRLTRIVSSSTPVTR